MMDDYSHYKTPTVHVENRQLYTETGERFFVKGIAFPAPRDPLSYNETAWIDVLKQLKNDVQLDINTVRVYRMDPHHNYARFFQAAAELGIYVLVPLTSASGAGNLDRDLAAPKCYNQTLFEYGVSCLQNFLVYPNALAGVVGNEVMNSLDTWPSAPCVKAYARDLQTYVHQNYNRPFPLVYTAQDSGMGAGALTNTKVMKLTADYLSCESDKSDDNDITNIDSESSPSGIDIFGVNVESWCSSKAAFRYNEDGTDGPYYELYKALENVSTALVFSEMGCPQSEFNRDNEVPDKTRAWNQIPIVVQNMSDTWSGFCAYAYSGSPDFDMTKGEGGAVWDGSHVRQPKEEMFNFRNQLWAAQNLSCLPPPNETARPLCSQVNSEMKLSRLTDAHGRPALYDWETFPNYALRKDFAPFKSSMEGPFVILCLVTLVAWSGMRWMRSRSDKHVQEETEPFNSEEDRMNYSTY